MVRNVSWCNSFWDSWRDISKPAAYKQRLEHTHTHTKLCGFLFVPCVVLLKTKRCALCPSNFSVHTKLTLSFRKVRHIFIYVLLLRKLLFNNRTKRDQGIINGVRRSQTVSDMFCYGVCWRVRAKLPMCLVMNCCVTAVVWTSRGKLHAFLTAALGADEWSASSPGRCTFH